MGIPPTIQMASLGMADSLILMVLALVVFGPRRLPQIGRQIGKLMYEFRKASNDFKFQMEEELRNAEEADRRRREEAERQQRLALNPSAEGAAAAETPAATDTYDTYGRDSENGYPYTGEYAEVPTPAEQPEENQPRIQPPSTGETVAAERPGSQPAAEAAEQESVTATAEATTAESVTAESVTSETAELAPASAGPASEPGESTAPKQETSSEREPATHNG